MSKRRRRPKVNPISIDKVWTSIASDYEKTRLEYESTWQKKKMIMIILYFLLILPGMIYHFFVWKPGANERQAMALQFVRKIYSKITSEYRDAKIEDVKSDIRPYVTPIEIPINRRANSRIQADHISKYFSKYRQKKDLSVFDVEVMDVISAHGLLEEIASDCTSSGGNTVSLTLIVTNSAKTSMKINGDKLNIYNLEISYERVTETTNDEGDTVYETEVATGFSGIVAEINACLNYPNYLLVRNKWVGGAVPKSISRVPWKDIKYPLAALPFNEAYVVRTDNEDGVAIRKVFQPRFMGALVDFANIFPPIAISYSPEIGKVLMTVDSLSFSDLPFYVGKTGRFFKDEETAKTIIARDVTPLIAMIKIYSTLKEKGFFQNLKEEFKKDLTLGR